MELKKILCAVDLKDSVNPAVEYAKMLSELSGASISAIYVVSSRSAYENLQVPVEDIAKGMRSIWSRARGDMKGAPPRRLWRSPRNSAST